MDKKKGKKISDEQIEFIASNLTMKPRDIAKRIGVSHMTVYRYLAALGIPLEQPKMSEFERYVSLLRRLENNPDIIESVLTDMEFNLPKEKIIKNAIAELGITKRETLHVIECVAPKRSQSRLRNALKKRQLSNIK